MAAAFRHGTYSKAFEFVDYKDRMLYSHARADTRAEGAALSLRTATTLAEGAEGTSAAATHLSERPVPWEASYAVALARNEDLSTRPAWLPPALGPARVRA